MHCDRYGPGQRPKSKVVPSTNTVLKNGQLQVQVVQKRMKIAMASLAPVTVTPLLAELYTQKHCDRYAPGQRPKSKVVPSTNTVLKNGQFLVQNAPHGHPEVVSVEKIDIDITIRESSCRERADNDVPTFSFDVMVNGGVPTFSFTVMVTLLPKCSTDKPTYVKQEKNSWMGQFSITKTISSRP